MEFGRRYARIVGVYHLRLAEKPRDHVSFQNTAINIADFIKPALEIYLAEQHPTENMGTGEWDLQCNLTDDDHIDIACEIHDAWCVLADLTERMFNLQYDLNQNFKFQWVSFHLTHERVLH